MEFNEAQWIKLVMLLADTQQWLQELCTNAMQQPPVNHLHKLQRSTYKLGIAAMAHILERHYYKIPRHPGTGKFHIPLTSLLHYLREAGHCEVQPIAGSLYFRRILHCSEPLGFNQFGEPAFCLTVITNGAGNIITAFPGLPSDLKHP